ncbi:helix-turn-helix transcriptional regulator [uncultured Microbacterium sp.]|uniref:helix-turn-helix domain-containing protein n=1 Tax=uncultured Microbacterium sp. TaxID=191216 RepID=UPI0028D4EB7F|nr:helix-turn-helix transcriptional regulator [uncultured Microbacterium sp.]
MLSVTVGQKVREYRVAHGITQDEFARAGRAYGLNWTASRVSELESGTLPVDLSTLIVIALAMNTVGPFSLTTVRTLVGDSLVPVTKRWSASVDTISGLLSDGHGLGAAEVGAVVPDAERAAFERSYDPERVARFMQGVPPKMTMVEVADLTARGATLAEKRAAKRLGVDPQLVILWAWREWGTSLDGRAQQLAVSDTPQARGHATRELVAALDAVIPTAARASRADG